jgi:hypothetical protein
VYRPQTSTEQKESTITNNAIKQLRKAFPDAFVMKIHGGGYQRAGIPDLHVSIRGRSVWIEMKRPGADTTALQKSRLEELAKTGAFCGTAESPERAIEIVNQILTEVNV